MIPTLAVAGRPLTSMRAAVRAAPMRLGLTSVAAIEFDVSTVRTTVVCFWLVGRFACGRASPTSSELSARSSSTGGTWRRQRGRRGMRFAHSAGLAAARSARRLRSASTT